MVPARAQVSVCRVADPTGTPLNVRTVPGGGKIVDTVRNGARVEILDTKNKWAYIGLLPEEDDIADRDKQIVPTGWVYREYLSCRDQAAKATTESRGERIGWIKSSDIECGGGNLKANECSGLDHYTDVHQKGGDCATYGIPVYDRPNGRPVGLLWNDDLPIIRGEQHEGFSFMYFSSPNTPDFIHGLMPYSIKALRGCG
jgi:hypothetical protein